MSETVAEVTSGDVNMGLSLVLADKGRVVDGFEDLAGPFVIDGTGLGEAIADPGFELGIAAIFGFLAHFMVVAANDEVVVFVIAGGEANIVVGVLGVVEETVFDTAFGDADRDAVGAEEYHFGHDAELLKGHAGGFNGVDAGNGVAALGADFDFFAQQTLLLDGHDARASVALEVRLLSEPFEHTEEVLGRMEGSLARVGDSISLVDFAIPASDGETLFVRGFDAELVHFLDFFLELLDVILMAVLTSFILRDVVSRQLAVFTLDAQFFGDFPHAVDGVGMAIDSHLSAILTPFTRQFDKARVDAGGEMTTRPPFALVSFV